MTAKTAQALTISQRVATLEVRVDRLDRMISEINGKLTGSLFENGIQASVAVLKSNVIGLAEDQRLIIDACELKLVRAYETRRYERKFRGLTGWLRRMLNL